MLIKINEKHKFRTEKTLLGKYYYWLRQDTVRPSIGSGLPATMVREEYDPEPRE